MFLSELSDNKFLQLPTRLIKTGTSMKNLLASTNDMINNIVSSSDIKMFSSKFIDEKYNHLLQETSGETENSEDSFKKNTIFSPKTKPRLFLKKENKDKLHKNDVDCTEKNGIIASHFLEGTLDISKSNDQQFQDSREKKESKGNNCNKKKSWYSNILSPTYKSRSENFKKIFKNVPDDEKLLIDYSCAMQREILVHGRLYVSQNYLCFYANIIMWETLVSVQWKDVTSITKEKTALIIPNAISIQTACEKFFFTSFYSRDKTYMMLFKLWQNALKGQSLKTTEMWEIVHDRYGKELGLTSDDEDCNSLLTSVSNEDKLSKHLSLESVSENNSEIENFSPSNNLKTSKSNIFKMNSVINNGTENFSNLCDVNNSNESEEEKELSVSNSLSKNGAALCTAPHDSRLLIKVSFPIHVDQLFTLLFTTSKFFLDFHSARKTTDLTQTAWMQDDTSGQKNRKVSLTVCVNKTVGPKTSQVTETQVMLPCTTPGLLYSINVESINSGIPYADSFSVFTHYCMIGTSETESTLEVYGEIKYKKNVWGLVKNFIDKNCWSGLQEYLNSLIKALTVECEEIEVVARDLKKKNKRRRVADSSTIMQTHSLDDKVIVHQPAFKLVSHKNSNIVTNAQADNVIFSWILLAAILCLIIMNCILYFKLHRIEEASAPAIMDLHVLKSIPKTEEDWMNLLQQQESLHTVETKKWQRILHTTIELLKQTQEALTQLQTSIHPTITEKMFSVLKPGLEVPSSDRQHYSSDL